MKQIRTWQETQALSRSTSFAGTRDDSLGMDLSLVSGFRIVLTAADGTTITGGTIVLYLQPVSNFLWTPSPTTLTFTPSTGSRTAISEDYETLVGAGRIIAVTSSITLSAGTTINVAIEAIVEPT
jgi:hypothetical protein